MNTKALRSKILDLAIHGKLLSEKEAVECRKGETATELLEKIRKEKEEKIAKGELKADKKSSYIFVGDDNAHYEKFADGTVRRVEDEIPFDVPDGWAWCRLGEICDFIGGGTPDKTKAEFWNGNIPWASVKDIKNTYLTKTIDKISETGLKQSAASLADIGDLIIVTRISPGKITQTKIQTSINQDLKIIKFKINISKLYALYFFNWNEKNFLSISSGTTVKGIKIEDLNSTLIPLPPLAEQKAIVAKIEEIFSQIDILENNKFDLQTTTKHAKSKILDLAIHGKLVPQNPNDEPASELLEKIHSDSKNATDNRRYQNIDNVEIEIPENWCFTYITEVLNIYTGNSINSTEKERKYTDVEGMNYIATKDIEFTGKINYRNGINIPDSYINKFKIAPKDSTLLCIEGGSAGRKIGFLNQEVCFVNKLCCFYSKYNFIENKYIYYFLQTPFFKSIFTNTKTGLIGGVSIETLKKFLLPLPPLAEQKRIVAKIESLFSILDQINENLS